MAGPYLMEKVRDIVGLYMDPPENAVVFAVDEKSQIQALERSAPMLPMVLGTPERRSDDYERHGTVDLFAALNIATGMVMGRPRRSTRRRISSPSSTSWTGGSNLAWRYI